MQVQKVRTTTYLPVDLMELAKQEALASKTSVTQLLTEGLEVRLGLKAKSRKKFKLNSYKLGSGKYVFRRVDAYE